MRNEILIFRTSVSDKQEIKNIGKILNTHNRIKEWNVDFDDREKVLRIECNKLSPAEIIAMLQKIEIHATELE